MKIRKKRQRDIQRRSMQKSSEYRHICSPDPVSDLCRTGAGALLYAGHHRMADRTACQSTGPFSGTASSHCEKAQFLWDHLRRYLADRAGLLLCRSLDLEEAGTLIGRLPYYYQALVQGLERIAENLQSVADRISPEMRGKIADLTEHFTGSLGQLVGSLGGSTVGAAGNMARNIPSILISFIFSLLFAYFFIAQRERLHRIGKKLMPEKTGEQLNMVWANMKYAVGGYFRAQFKIMGVVALILAAGLLFMRIEYAVLWAALIALLDFLPMLGTGTVLLPWAAFCALSDALPRAAGLLVLYVVTQLTRQLIQPKMVGDSIGVDTLTTLFLLFVGYRLAGILGMIIAVPVGLIVIQFYEAGAFEEVTENIRELVSSIEEWRHKEESEERYRSCSIT